MYALIIIIHVIICLILIATILLQSGRGGGISDMLGGASSQTIFGTRASTFLTRATTIAASLFLITCLGLTIFSSFSGRSLLEGKAAITEQAETESVAEVVPKVSSGKPQEPIPGMEEQNLQENEAIPETSEQPNE